MRRTITPAALHSILVLAMASPAAADLPFEGPSYAVYNISGPASVATADLNRDGHVDVAFTSIELGQVRIRFGGPSPSLLTLENGYDGARDVRIADLNGDGWPDVTAANISDPDLKVCCWHNPGAAGGPWPRHIVTTTFDFTTTTALAVGDVDGDGDVDIIAGGKLVEKSYITWYENISGDGEDWRPWNVMAWGVQYFTGTYGLVVADLDQDGRMDLGAVAYDENQVAWFSNDGTIHDNDTWPMHTIESGFGGASSITAADLDQDGDPDLVATAYQDDDVVWFENLGWASGWDAHTIDSSLNSAFSVATADLDHDGDVDVIASSYGDDEVVWYERNVWGGYVRHDISTSFDGARSVVAVDFDDDGDMDVLAAGQYDDDIAWWENRSIHTTAAFVGPYPVEDVYPQPTSLDLGDFDLDGDLDIVGTMFNNTGDRDLFWWSLEGGTWVGHDILGWADGASAVEVADIDADGIDDLVVAGATSDSVRWFRGLGSGNFVTATVGSGLDGARDVAVADLDCDGDLDIAAVGSQSGQLVWYANDDGDGGSWTGHLVTTFTFPVALGAGDLDRDGRTDLVVADETAGIVWALTHVDCWNTWGLAAIDNAFAGPKDVEVADLNDDGWPDVAAAAAGADRVTVWLNGGAGWTWESHDVATGIDAWDLAVADVDSDGALDIVAAARLDDVVRWWRNSGNGASWIANTPLDASLDGARAVAVGDLDSDGLPEVVAASTEADLVNMYLNIGGQYDVWNQDLAPATMADSELAPILRFLPIHDGPGDDPPMELRHVILRLDDGTGTPLSSAGANALIEVLHVWYDANGNSEIDFDTDVMLAVVSDLTLDANGYLTVDVPHGGGNPAVEQTTFYPFMVAVTTTPDASSHTRNRFRLSHLPASMPLGSSVPMHYYDWPDIPLRPLLWDTFHTSTVTCSEPADLVFADGFESGGVGQWDGSLP